jgi:hypothetical protein
VISRGSVTWRVFTPAPREAGTNLAENHADGGESGKGDRIENPRDEERQRDGESASNTVRYRPARKNSFFPYLAESYEGFDEIAGPARIAISPGMES